MALMAGGQSAPTAARNIVEQTLPDVIWLMEYPDEAGHQRSLKARLESPEFEAVR